MNDEESTYTNKVTRTRTVALDALLYVLVMCVELWTVWRESSPGRATRPGHIYDVGVAVVVAGHACMLCNCTVGAGRPAGAAQVNDRTAAAPIDWRT